MISSRRESTNLTFIPRPLALLMLCLAAFSVAAQQEPARLVLTSAAAGAGDTTEIEIHLENSQSRIAALTFVVEYDESRLAFDPSRNSASRITFNLPSGFVAHTFPIADEARLGIAIYDPDAPVSVLSDGLLARIRFALVPGAEGTASVRLAAPIDAADRNAMTVALAGPSSSVLLPLNSAVRDGIMDLRDVRNPSDRTHLPDAPVRPDLFPSKWLLPVPEMADRRWRTSLSMENPSERDAHVRLTLVKQSAVRLSREIELGPGEVRIFDDLVQMISTGSMNDGTTSGGIILESTSDQVLLNARIVEQQAGGAFLERALPLVEWDDLIHAGERRTFITSMRPADPFLLTLVNAGDMTTTVMAEVRSSEGTILDRKSWTLLPGGVIGGIELGRYVEGRSGEVLLIDVTSPDAGARYLAYTSRRDPGTRAPLIEIPR